MKQLSLALFLLSAILGSYVLLRIPIMFMQPPLLESKKLILKNTNPVLKLNPVRRLLCYVREGDHTHPGDEAAVEIVLQQALKFNPSLKYEAVLDVGCGFGGTVNLFGDHGFKNIQGFDIDQPSVDYAKATYPNSKFSVCDALDIDQHVAPQSTSLFTMFSVLVFIQDKKRLFQVLGNIAEPGALIAIWDYVKAESAPQNTLQLADKTPMQAISSKQLHSTLDAAGWDIIFEQDWTIYFSECYQILLQKIQKQKKKLEELFTPQAVTQTLNIYTPLRDRLESGELEGILIFAKKR